MAKNIGTLAILSENANLSENCCSCKCFGTRMFIFFVCIGTTQKKKQKKSQIWYNSTQNPKNALDKIIGNLNLIFGSTPFGKNYWNQSLPVTMNEFLTPLYWNLGRRFFCKLLQVIQIWRMPSPNCCFEISPQVFYGIQIWTHCWPFQNSPALCLSSRVKSPLFI